jgi:hypothetical protein
MSAPQNLHETFSLLFSFGTIWSRPHLGQVRLSRRIVGIIVENIVLIGFEHTNSRYRLELQVPMGGTYCHDLRFMPYGGILRISKFDQSLWYHLALSRQCLHQSKPAEG